MHPTAASHTRRHHLRSATTSAVQGYPMRDEDLDENPDNHDHDGGIRTAVGAWFADPAAAKARYGPIASWDTSGVTRMSWLFSGKPDFNEDISRWNVSNVVTMHYMFKGAESFTGDLSRWEVGQVEHMTCMFQNATSFNGDLSRWEVGQVEDMVGMFYGATSFNGDLSSWEVGQVKSMDVMFSGATSFTGELGGAWAANTTRKYRMFHNSPGAIAGKTKAADGTVV